MRHCRPEHIEPPLSIRAERHAGLDCTEFFLHQRYFRNTMLLPRGLEVRSVLVVHTDAEALNGAVRILSDRLGRRPLIIWSLAVSSITMPCFGFAPNIGCAIAARAVDASSRAE